MLTRDLLIETYTAIMTNKVRTALTMLGIVIGIGSVIIMTAVGRGAQNDIEESIQSIGANLLMVQPGAGRGFGPVASGSSADSLTLDDVEAIRQKSEYISYIAPQITGRYQVIAGNENINTSVVGTTSDYAIVRGSKLKYGSFLTSVDDQRMSRAIVFGSDASDDLFGEGNNPVGQKVRIQRISFTVVGVLTQTGINDDTLYAPLKTVGQYLSGGDSLGSIDVSVRSSEEMDIAEEEITEILLQSHNIQDADLADFRVRNQADIISVASDVTGAMTFLLGAVASISLVVGGIGIMNMMLTSVTERTREIGLRKALGATINDIRLQFLLEAIALTLFGGILGVLLGFGVSWFVDTKLGYASEVSQMSVVVAFGVSAAIGVVFGLYPAWRASKLDPMKALRYE